MLCTKCFRQGIYFVGADEAIPVIPLRYNKNCIPCVNMHKHAVIFHCHYMSTEISHRFPIEHVMGILWEIKAVRLKYREGMHHRNPTKFSHWEIYGTC